MLSPDIDLRTPLRVSLKIGLARIVRSQTSLIHCGAVSPQLTLADTQSAKTRRPIPLGSELKCRIFTISVLFCLANIRWSGHCLYRAVSVQDRESSIEGQQ